MNYSRIYNAYIYVYVFMCIFYMFILFTVAFYIITLHIYFIYFCKWNSLRKEFGKWSDSTHFLCEICLLFCSEYRMIPVSEAINRSVEKVKMCVWFIHRDIQSNLPARVTQAWETYTFASKTLLHFDTRIMLYEDPSARERMHLDAARCTLPHLGARVGYTDASPEMDGKTRQLREIIFALCVWNVTLRFATWFMCGVGFMVGCNKHVVEINNGSSGWV